MITATAALFWFTSPLLALGLLLALFLILRQRRRLADLENEARHDLLTGLPNRRGLKLAWESIPHDKALLLIDLVGFKAMNDSHGHLFGDQLLKLVARRLEGVFSPHGILCRWGGDEFAAIIPADRIAHHIEILDNAQTLPYLLTGAEGRLIHVQIGSRVGIGLGASSLGEAIAMADARLMEARLA